MAPKLDEPRSGEPCAPWNLQAELTRGPIGVSSAVIGCIAVLRLLLCVLFSINIESWQIAVAALDAGSAFAPPIRFFKATHGLEALVIPLAKRPACLGGHKSHSATCSFPSSVFSSEI